MRLSVIERESILNWNMSEDVAYFYSCNPREWRHFESLGVKPTEIRRDSGGSIYAMDFTVPKRWCKLPRPPRQATESQREAARKNMAKMRSEKAPRIHSKV